MEEMPLPPKAIFFDVGNTLLFPDRAHILTPLSELGHSPTLDHWQAVERATKNEFDKALEQGNPSDSSFWRLFYERLLSEFGVADQQIRNSLVEATHRSENWRTILPGTREILQRLGERYPLAVISNADGKIVEVLRRCGIEDCFASITDSGLVGYEKPHPEIFKQALAAMNVAPEDGLYLGDIYSVDYVGATRCGMQAILMDVSGAYRDTALPRIEKLAELGERLR